MTIRTRWGYGGAIAALAVAVGSCNDTQHPMSPGPGGGGDTVPVFTATTPFNNAGACMLDDAMRFPAYTTGFQSALLANNCTTNDVRLANATATQYDLGDGTGFHVYDPNNPPVCANSTITLKLKADLVQTSNSERNDFGIWIRTDAGSADHPLIAANGDTLGARTGSCNHYNLPTDPLLTATTNVDGDQCADLVNAATSQNLDLGTVTVPCLPTANGKLIINSCIGWKVPGDEGDPTKNNKGQCPAYAEPDKPPGGAFISPLDDAFRAGTLPGNTSKCNCEGFELNILVPTNLTIEKQTVGGTASFDYTITGSGLTAFSRNTGSQGNPTSTSAFEFTPAQFGDKYVTETALAGWTLTGISCSADGAVIAIGTGQGVSFSQGATAGFDPGDNTVKVTITSADTPTCTFTNTRDASIAIQKQTVGGTASFDYTVTGSGLSAFSRNTAGANPTASAAVTITPAQFGDKYVTETALAGYTLTSISCTANGADIAIGTGQGVAFAQGTTAGFDAGDNTVKITVGAGDTPTCTFVNTAGSSLAIQKQTIGGTDSFDYTVSGGGLSAFSRNTGSQGNPTATAPIALTGADAVGDKYVTETAKAGWTLTNIICSAGSATVAVGTGQGGSFAEGATSGYDAGDNTVKVTVAAGNSPSCTFVNTKDASLDIEKQTIGAAASFDFSGTGADVPGSFSRNTNPTNPTASAAFAITGNDLGDKYVQETVTSGYALTNIVCTANGATVVIGRGGSGAFENGGGDGFNAGDNTVKVTVGAGNTPTCTFTNTQDASLAIQKQTVGATGSFDFVGTGAGVPGAFSRNTGSANPTAEAAFVISGASLGDKYAQETIPAGYAITNIVCTANGATVAIGQGGSGAFNQGTTAGYDAGDNTVKVTAGAGNTPTCTFTNTELATLIITKTIGGSLDQTALFDFSRALGATYTTTPSFAPLTHGGSNNSGKVLLPGSYMVCELNVAVALTVSATLDAVAATLTDQSAPGGNTDLCTPVTLSAGQTRTVAFTNSLVVGTGGTRTIGYWKNWASCARGLAGTGQQYLKAIGDGGVGIEFTLDGNIGVGEPDIYPIGDIAGPITCEQAVALLSKDAMDGSKRAGDPIYNMVAQLLGAKLNIHAGSGTCADLTDAGGYLDRAQTLLAALDFTGLNPAWPKKGPGSLSPAQLTEAQFLAGKLGAYNEGTLGGGCPTHV